MGGLEGIPVASMVQDDTGLRPPFPVMERVSALRKPRLGAPVEFVHDDFVHPTFNFCQVQTSKPQMFIASVRVTCKCSSLSLDEAFPYKVTRRKRTLNRCFLY